MARSRANGALRRPADVWRSLFRIGIGGFWLYFGAQKWPPPLGVPPHGIAWVHPLLEQSARTNPVPGLGSLIGQLVLPNWQLFATAETVGETAAGVLLILGLATRAAGLLGTLLGINLSLTIAFLIPDPGLRWLYYLPVLASFEVFVNGAGALALERARWVPAWLSS
jgi:uncharacterized membrane protein YphA (DoxX/SURF4 family)